VGVCAFDVENGLDCLERVENGWERLGEGGRGF
jgi:hypothetical protein